MHFESSRLSVIYAAITPKTHQIQTVSTNDKMSYAVNEYVQNAAYIYWKCTCKREAGRKKSQTITKCGEQKKSHTFT